MPPAVVESRLAGSGREFKGMTIWPLKLPPTPLIHHAASKAFRRIDQNELKEYCTLRSIPMSSPPPRTEHQWAALAVKHELPKLDDATVNSLVQAYRAPLRARGPCKSAINADNVELVAGLVEDDDAKDIRVSVAKRAAAEKFAKTKQAAKGKVRQSRVKYPPGKHDFSLEEARKFLPKDTKGCVLSRDDKLHMRWEISYPNKEPPYSTSAVWTEERSSRQALFMCLRWCWACHLQATDAVCPYDFS